MIKCIDDALSLWGVLSMPIVFLCLVSSCEKYGSVKSMEHKAIYGGYGTYDEAGSFKWKHEMEKETLIKDFEFLKRLEENRKTAPVPEIMPLPKTQDLFN